MKKYLLFESTKDASNSIKHGQKRLVKAGGRSICLVRIDDKLIAFDNACPHRGHPLNEGSINHLGEIVCISHSYRFNLITGHEKENNCPELKFYPVIVENGKIYIEC